MGRPKTPPDRKQSVQIGLKLTPRQWQLLQRIARHVTAQARAGARHAPEITPVEVLRMMIMTTAEDMGFIESVLDEPASAFDLKPKKKEKP
jgi:hypothetical protein